MDILFTKDQSARMCQNVTDLYELYRLKEVYKLWTYRYLAYVLGTIIFLSNLPVVVSSGLILKKGQKPRSTYMLLGNVSLADTIVGVSLISGALIDGIKSPSTVCIIEIGMMVCPAMVSIFSVGLIAVDRYIYILHGLYYKRWFNTTRVRIGIVLIWMIGIILGFMPAAGWVNEELKMTRCFYVSLFPGALVLINSFLSLIPIVVVAVLYSIILVKALKTVKTIKGTRKIKDMSPITEKPKLRMNRGTVMDRKNNPTAVKPDKIQLKRSASFTISSSLKTQSYNNQISNRSKSIEILPDEDKPKIISKNMSEINLDSNLSVYTIESIDSINLSSADNKHTEARYTSHIKPYKSHKIKEPNKWRAITVVLLTTGTFIITWIPFFIAVIFFVFCEEKLTNPKCIQLRFLLGGPFPFLAFTNSLVNPLIYAWWHKGFNESVKMYYKKYFHHKFFCRVNK